MKNPTGKKSKSKRAEIDPQTLSRMLDMDISSEENIEKSESIKKSRETAKEFMNYWTFIAKEIRYGNEDAIEQTKKLVKTIHKCENYYKSLKSILECVDDPDRKNHGMYFLEELYSIFSDVMFFSNPASKTTQHYYQSKQSEEARTKRAEKPEIAALHAAIDKELQGNPINHPYKQAESILDSVNKHLKESHFNPVKVDSIARFLKKRAETLKKTQDLPIQIAAFFKNSEGVRNEITTLLKNA